MRTDFYWTVAKYTFCVVGGGSAALAVVVGTYKGVKNLATRLADRVLPEKE